MMLREGKPVDYRLSGLPGRTIDRRWVRLTCVRLTTCVNEGAGTRTQDLRIKRTRLRLAANTTLSGTSDIFFNSANDFRHAIVC